MTLRRFGFARLHPVRLIGLHTVCLISLYAGLLMGGASAPTAALAQGLNESDQSPLVSGFERFGRHGEIMIEQAGALLIGELNCVACHKTNDPSLESRGGPVLRAAGVRLQGDWIREFLADPNAAKPGTTMPHVLADLDVNQRADTIEALVAFLSSQLQPFPSLKATGLVPVPHEFWAAGDSDRGSRLYHTVGCVACHEPDDDYETVQSKPSAVDALIEQLDPEEIEALGLAGAARTVASVPHADLEKKYTRRSLTMLLFDPASVRPGARMPSLRLLPSEAADIAAFLLGDQAPPPSQISGGLIARGRELFRQHRCANCHDVEPSADPIMAKPMAKLNFAADASCVQNAQGSMAAYRLDNDQAAAVRARLRQPSKPRSASDQVLLTMLQLNCFACHERDGLGGVGRNRKPFFETVGNVDLGDEGRLPPPLTGVGGKLRSKALASVFQPRSPRQRPFMKVRMPTYHKTDVEAWLRHVEAADEPDSGSEAAVFGDSTGADLAEAGRQLIDTGCVQCHPLRGESLPGVVGVDLHGAPQRIRPKWFHDFVFNPAEVKSRTRMPTFFPNGESNRKDLLDGDVRKQIASLWFYLKDLDRQPLPDKIDEVRSATYELSPTGRPIVLRTFMQAAGTHAIAVGFPQGVHYAFDAESVRLAAAWKGRFLDARGTWFERFTPPADPLGEPVQSFRSGSLLMTRSGQKSDRPRFLGYRLDAAGTPTLLYAVGDVDVRDRIEPTGQTGLRRTLDLTARRSQPVELTLRAHAGRELRRQSESVVASDEGLTVQLLAGVVAEQGRIHQSEASAEWLIPFRIERKQTIVMEYQW